MHAGNSSRPAKPYPDFPLYAHKDGQWTKTVRGKKKRFGSWRKDPTGRAALREFERFTAKRTLGLADAADPDVVTVGEVFKRYMESRARLLEARDPISAKTYKNEVGMVKRLACFELDEFDGASICQFAVNDLQPEHFDYFAAAINKRGWASKTWDNHVGFFKSAMKWALRNGIIEQLPRYGDQFNRSSEGRRRKEAREKNVKLFEREELWAMIGETTRPQMTAMLWLGINAGFHNVDFARVPLDAFENDWIRLRRHKRGEVMRAAWLWPETRKALAMAVKARPKRARPGAEHLLFLTQQGRPWVDDQKHGGLRDAVSHEFREIRKAAGCYRDRVGFGAIRHTFQTEAEVLVSRENIVGGPQAIANIMGHVTDAKIEGMASRSQMARNYSHKMDEDCIKLVCQQMRAWFLDGKPRRKRKAS